MNPFQEHNCSQQQVLPVSVHLFYLVSAIAWTDKESKNVLHM